MNISWGWKIAFLYMGFVALIVSLVILSCLQHFDLVSKDYYGEEIAYQSVIDAGKNQSKLSAPITIHVKNEMINIGFPAEFKGKQVSGEVNFYSPVNALWDHSFKISAHENSMDIAVNLLQKTKYTVKISFESDGKKYYQESELMLHAK